MKKIYIQPSMKVKTLLTARIVIASSNNLEKHEKEEGYETDEQNARAQNIWDNKW